MNQVLTEDDATMKPDHIKYETLKAFADNSLNENPGQLEVDFQDDKQDATIRSSQFPQKV